MYKSLFGFYVAGHLSIFFLSLASACLCARADSPEEAITPDSAYQYVCKYWAAGRQSDAEHVLAQAMASYGSPVPLLHRRLLSKPV